MAGSVSNGCIEGAVFRGGAEGVKAGAPNLAAFGVTDDVAFSVGWLAAVTSRCSSSLSARFHQQLMGLLDENARRRCAPTWSPARPPPPRGRRRGRSSPVEKAIVHRNRFAGRRILVIVGRDPHRDPAAQARQADGLPGDRDRCAGQVRYQERFPDADELIVAWPDEAASKLKLDNSTYVVILTHDPKFDLPRCGPCSGGRGYIGAIGSRKTNEEPVRGAAARKASRRNSFRASTARSASTSAGVEQRRPPWESWRRSRAVPVWGLWIINAWGSQALSPLEPGLRAFPESPCFLAVAAGGHGHQPARMVARQVEERPPACRRVAQL